ncbi:MAG: TIGR01458 family HAD-type hydrolase [Candidatus Krumholzibacteria bacterium]|nr:TIGR01458 family HAD-type hydrolase [Candidatus Krumholzibacteria bacterium]
MFAGVRGILFDLDGVVHVGDEPIPGAVETLRYLQTKSVRYRFVTNTTTKSEEDLYLQMTGMGLPVERGMIFSTHRITAEYLRQMGNPRCYLLVADSVRGAYQGIPQSESSPQYVVIGDIGERWNYHLLNRVFNMIMDGAEMIALHKGRYWSTQAGLQMDIGAFVTGLEYTTGKKATVLGKPAAAFFETALKDLGLQKHEVIMVGDDIDTDVAGAQQAGIRGVLVRTGKYRADSVATSGVQPDAVLDSISVLRQCF